MERRLNTAKFAIAEMVKRTLDRAGFVVDAVTHYADAREALALTAYDAAILDLGLPDGDGLRLLAERRDARNPVPVPVLTARDSVEARMSGLDGGSDQRNKLDHLHREEHSLLAQPAISAVTKMRRMRQ